MTFQLQKNSNVIMTALLLGTLFVLYTYRLSAPIMMKLLGYGYLLISTGINVVIMLYIAVVAARISGRILGILLISLMLLIHILITYGITLLIFNR